MKQEFININKRRADFFFDEKKSAVFLLIMITDTSHILVKLEKSISLESFFLENLQFIIAFFF